MSIEFSEIFLSMLPAVAGAGAFALGIEFLKVKLDRRLKEKYGESSQERIDRLAKSLKEATSLSSEIEAEINRRHHMLERLKNDVERYDELAKIKATEVEAIVQTMRGELEKESNKSFWKAAAINLVFFIAGIIVTVVMA